MLHPKRASWSELIVLLGIVAVGTGVRLVGFGSFPFWEDELYTMQEVNGLFHGSFTDGVALRPLYFVVQYIASIILPDTAAGYRALPFLLGILGLWVTWKIGRSLFGATAGLVAAGLLAIAPFHMYASQMARYFSLLYLLSALSFFALIRAYDTDRPRDHLLALLALLLTTAAHPTSLAPLAGAALACSLVTPDSRLGWNWPTRRGWVLVWVPFILALGAAYLALRSTSIIASGPLATEPRTMLGTLRLLPGVVERLTPEVTMAGGLGGVLVGVFGATRSERRWGLMTVLGFALGSIAALLGSRRLGFTGAHLTAVFPLFYVAAGGLVQLGADRMAAGRQIFAITATAVIVSGVLPSTISHLLDGSRFDYRPAFRAIRIADPELTVATWPIIQPRYYAPDLTAVELPLDGSTAMLDSLLIAEGDFWVVASIRRYGMVFDDKGERLQWLRKHCRLEMSHEKPRLDYEVFRVELYRCAGDGQQKVHGAA